MHRAELDSGRRLPGCASKGLRSNSALTCEYDPGPTSLEARSCLKRASVDLKADDMTTEACWYWGV
jgi:hypothetical protein